MTERSDYTAGLRMLADLLDANPDVPLPHEGRLAELMIFCDDKAEIAAVARAFPGRKDKHVEDYDSYGFRLTGSLAGLKWEARVDRQEVCTAVVTGTRTVSRRKPVVWETEEVEEPEITWECSPLLDGEPVSS